MQPFAGLGWIEPSADGASETDGPAALEVADGDLAQIYSNLGFMTSRTMPLLGMTWTPSLRAAWQHGFSSGTPTRNAQLLSGSSVLTTAGAPLAHDQGLVNTDLGVALDEGASLSVGY